MLVINMSKSRDKCVARGQDVHFCDGCKTTSTKCPYRDKYRDLRHTKKGDTLYHTEDLKEDFYNIDKDDGLVY